MHYWMVAGTLENWKEAFEKGNIWGFTEKQRHRWDALQEGDVIFFYVMRPIAGIIGYGAVKTKFHQTQPLWSEEIVKNKVIWPMRFEFNVEHCFPPDKWETDKLSSELLRFRANLSFRQFEVPLAQETISRFKGRLVEQLEEPVSHWEIRDKLIEIGKLQNYIAEGEYSFDLGKLDVVWRRVERSVPTYAFEVYVKGDLYHDLSKLKHAFDLWNSRIFVVASRADYEKVKALLSGSFHEIKEQLRFIDLEKVKQLYESKRAFLDLEKELGI